MKLIHFTPMISQPIMKNLIHIWLFYYSWVTEGKIYFCQPIDLIKCLNCRTYQLIISYRTFFYCQVFIALSLSFARGWTVKIQTELDVAHWLPKIFENIDLYIFLCIWRWWQMRWDEPSYLCGKNIKHYFQLVTIFQVVNFTETANPLKLKIEVKAFSPCLLASRLTVN